MAPLPASGAMDFGSDSPGGSYSPNDGRALDAPEPRGADGCDPIVLLRGSGAGWGAGWFGDVASGRAAAGRALLPEWPLGAYVSSAHGAAERLRARRVRGETPWQPAAWRRPAHLSPRELKEVGLRERCYRSRGDVR